MTSTVSLTGTILANDGRILSGTEVTFDEKGRAQNV
jgi:hypothetical protein